MNQIWPISELRSLLGGRKRTDQQLARPPPEFDLDTPLLMLSPADAFTIRDACEGVQIFGATGSGKTSGSGAALAKAFLRHGFGGLVLCAKPDERQLWERYARETGRSESVVIFSPDGPYRFNYLDYELRREGQGGGSTENLVHLFANIVEIAEGKVEQNSGDSFWQRGANQLLRNAIDLLYLAQDSFTVGDVYRLISEAPQSLAQAQPRTKLEREVDRRSWEQDNADYLRWVNTSYLASCLSLASDRAKTAREKHDLGVAANYWLKEFPATADRTRSGIVSTFSGVADMLSHGISWELLGTTTNVVPEVTYRDGAIIIVDLPVREYHDVGRVVQGIWKLMFQRAVLRRDVTQHPRPVFLWADEAQNFTSSFDFRYQAETRSARGCTVYLTQNVNNYYAVLGTRARDESNSLLGNFQTKIFHTNGDFITNQFAADSIGQRWVMANNFGANASDNGYSHSSGMSQMLVHKVLPAEFTMLKNGGAPNNKQVEAIVFKAGRPWQATGDTYIKTIFTQP